VQQRNPTASTRPPVDGAFVRVSELSLRRFTERLLEAQGLTAEDAAIGADALVTADLMGIDSHGVAHLATHLGYVPGFKAGIVRPRPQIRVVHETLTTARVDGDAGFGPVVAHRAMGIAIEKARALGVGMVAVDNARHFGAAGYYALLAAGEDMIGVALCSAKPQVYPAGGRRPALGTNPIAVAVPTASGDPFLLDMATSVVAMGKLEIAEREGKPIPEGWGADAEGVPATDVRVVRSRGGLLPLGSTVSTSSYKGYGLGMVVDILCGVLSGAGFGLLLDTSVLAAGFFFAAIRVDAFRPAADFKIMMDQMLLQLRAVPPVEGAGGVLVPGEREFDQQRERRRRGIPLHHTVYESLLGHNAEFRLGAKLEPAG
jgi:L-2-hydroxycarboxylate dehydrogenase (NAD+)